MLIAVDFDDTILKHGIANRELIDYLNRMQRNGAKIILWSCRKGESRVQAIEFCKNHGLVFDGVIEDKILADLYIDDKAKRPEEIVIGNQRKNRMTRLSEQRR